MRKEERLEEEMEGRKGRERFRHLPIGNRAFQDFGLPPPDPSTMIDESGRGICPITTIAR